MSFKKGQKVKLKMDERIIEYAPILIVVLGFIWQNNIFVKPETLEKKHREILQEVDKKLEETEKNFSDKYVEVNAYKEFQNHIYSELEKVTKGINDLKDFLMGKK